MQNFIPAEQKVNLEIRAGWCSAPAVDVTAWEVISKIWVSREEIPTWWKNFGENTFKQSVLGWGCFRKLQYYHECECRKPPMSKESEPEQAGFALSLPSLHSLLIFAFLGQPRECRNICFELVGKKGMTADKHRLWSKSPASISILRYILPSSLFVFLCYT